MSRRVLALILALSMAFGMLGANVYAADVSDSSAADVSASEMSEALPEPGPEQSEAEEVAPAEVSGDEVEESAPDEDTGREAEESAPEVESEAPAEETLAVQAVASGTCGENLTWTLDDSGTLTISGTGDMEDYEAFILPPWGDYNLDSITGQ